MADFERLLADLAVAYGTRDPVQIEAALKPILACKAKTVLALMTLLDIQARTEATVRQATLDAHHVMVGATA